MNIGEYFQQVNGPELLYCPMANSSRKMGMPRKARAMQYGMKKAPDVKGKQMRKPRYTKIICSSYFNINMSKFRILHFIDYPFTPSSVLSNIPSPFISQYILF